MQEKCDVFLHSHFKTFRLQIYASSPVNTSTSISILVNAGYLLYHIKALNHAELLSVLSNAHFFTSVLRPILDDPKAMDSVSDFCIILSPNRFFSLKFQDHKTIVNTSSLYGIDGHIQQMPYDGPH